MVEKVTVSVFMREPEQKEEVRAVFFFFLFIFEFPPYKMVGGSVCGVWSHAGEH